ncbi:MAG: hypothetical protein KAR42_08320 [candidate division Zixibacteria bacterium]|nr:hypothetical protein [candidate division Zixibacteria bacterium]
MIKKILGVVFILVIIGIGAAYIYRNMIVETTVEEATTYALGVDADLGSAGLDIGAGSLELNDYTIENPEGFEADNFFEMNLAKLVLDAGSVFDDEIVVDTLVLEGIRLSMEQIDTKNNIKAILDNIKKVDFGESSDSDQKMKIKYAAIRDIGIDATATFMGKKQLDKSFVVDNFTMNDIGGDSGATIAEVTSKVLKEILTRASAAGTSQLGIDVDKLKEEAKDKVESEVKSQLKGLGDKLKGN